MFILFRTTYSESWFSSPSFGLHSNLFNLASPKSSSNSRRKDYPKKVGPPPKLSSSGNVRSGSGSRTNPPMKESRDFENTEESVPLPSTKNFAQKTIWGQNIINIRPFNVDGQRTFEFLGSFQNNVPVYPSPEIAFLGRSNVGKSSLLNCLTGQNKKIAIESKSPGRTRGINLFRCSDREGPICIFVDLPGYGFAKMAQGLQESITDFVRMYLDQRGSLRLAVVLVDIRREPLSSDLAMVQYLQEAGLPYLVVATKVDKISANEVTQASASIRKAFTLPDNQPLTFSSVTGHGRKSLWHAIRKGLLGDEEVPMDINDNDNEDGDGDYDDMEDGDEDA
eukprot:gene9790-20361_t